MDKQIIMQNEVVEFIKDIPDNLFNEPLIENLKPLKGISEEEVKRIKEKHQKKFVETKLPPKPIIAINQISEEEVEKIKSKNKRKSKEFKEMMNLEIKNFK